MRESVKQTNKKKRLLHSPFDRTCFKLSHLHLHGSSLYLRDALGNDEGDAVTGTTGHLRELPAEQQQTTLQLLVATLDGQGLQTTLVTRQETLQGDRRRRC